MRAGLARAKVRYREYPRRVYQGFGFLDVLVPEQELTVKVGEVDGVEVYNVDVSEAGEHQVLEQLTSNAASADHKDARL